MFRKSHFEQLWGKFFFDRIRIETLHPRPGTIVTGSTHLTFSHLKNRRDFPPSRSPCKSERKLFSVFAAHRAQIRIRKCANLIGRRLCGRDWLRGISRVLGGRRFDFFFFFCSFCVWERERRRGWTTMGDRGRWGRLTRARGTVLRGQRTSGGSIQQVGSVFEAPRTSDALGKLPKGP